MKKPFLFLLLTLSLLSSCKKFKEKQLHKKRQDILEITITNYSTNNPLDFSVSLEEDSVGNTAVYSNTMSVSVNSYIKFDYDCRNKLKQNVEFQDLKYRYIMNGQEIIKTGLGIENGEMFIRGVNITINDEEISYSYVFWAN